MVWLVEVEGFFGGFVEEFYGYVGDEDVYVFLWGFGLLLLWFWIYEVFIIECLDLRICWGDDFWCFGYDCNGCIDGISDCFFVVFVFFVIWIILISFGWNSKVYLRVII